MEFVRPGISTLSNSIIAHTTTRLQLSYMKQPMRKNAGQDFGTQIGRTRLWPLAVILLLPFMPLDRLQADQVVAQRLVSSTESTGSTLGWPRWKGYMSQAEPNRIWISYAGGSGSAPTFNYTTDAGDSWNSSTIQISFDGYLDEHLSCAGTDSELYFTWPGSDAIMFRSFDYPAQSENDRGPLVSLNNTTYQHRSNVMVEPTGRIWVFTRRSGSASENVRYQYSDNGGASWTTGVAFATNADNIRFGSMPYIDGRPALVVLYLDDNRGYEYYLWNGSAFEARPDHAIFPQNVGQVRDFTHTVVSDSVFHMLFGLDNGLHHVWKNYNNGSGAWNHAVIETSTTTSDIEWSPITTVRGNELYVFYVHKSSADPASSQIYYKRWSQATQTWTAPVRISDPAISVENVHPNTVFSVPTGSTAIPVFWSAGSGPYQIYFSKVVVDPYAGGDQTAPERVTDLAAETGSIDGQMRLTWTAPGDDGRSGTASYYVLKYSTAPITALNWNSAITYPSPPPPLSGGERQSFTMGGLTPGQEYFVALRAYDDVNNAGAVSNSPMAFACGILTPNPLQTAYDPQAATLHLTCQAVSSYHSLVYQFALDSLPGFPQPDLRQAPASGSSATVQYAGIDSGLVYFWRCRAVASDFSATSAWSSPVQTHTGVCCLGERGNVNCDSNGDINLTDVSTLAAMLFVTFEPACCPEAADVTGDGVTNLSDLTLLVNHLFLTFEPTASCP